mmetsp:Transcript_4951/g.31730  ORF Transcript_4951/g.31730 Transcript_4951/m.31730 type:complete len:423 (-) Transcript_4951:383-1651(-)
MRCCVAASPRFHPRLGFGGGSLPRQHRLRPPRPRGFGCRSWSTRRHRHDVHVSHDAVDDGETHECTHGVPPRTRNAARRTDQRHADQAQSAAESEEKTRAVARRGTVDGQRDVRRSSRRRTHELPGRARRRRRGGKERMLPESIGSHAAMRAFLSRETSKRRWKQLERTSDLPDNQTNNIVLVSAAIQHETYHSYSSFSTHVTTLKRPCLGRKLRKLRARAVLPFRTCGRLRNVNRHIRIGSQRVSKTDDIRCTAHFGNTAFLSRSTLLGLPFSCEDCSGRSPRLAEVRLSKVRDTHQPTELAVTVQAAQLGKDLHPLRSRKLSKEMHGTKEHAFVALHAVHCLLQSQPVRRGISTSQQVSEPFYAAKNHDQGHQKSAERSDHVWRRSAIHPKPPWTTVDCRRGQEKASAYGTFNRLHRRTM